MFSSKLYKSSLPSFSLIRDFGTKPAETFPKFPSIIHVIDRSDRNSPITARLACGKEGVKVTLVAVIGGFRSDLSITRKTDGNFGNVSAGVLFSKVAYQGKRWY